MRLRTRRLVLRSWRTSDVQPYYRNCNTPEVMRWLGGVQPRVAVIKDVEAFQRAERRDGFTFWVVERAADHALLGFCGLWRIHEQDCRFSGDVEIGWRIRADAWRQGYAFEAATAVLKQAFKPMAIESIVSRTSIGNIPSRRLMRKLGMRRRRELDYWPRGEGIKLVVYSLTADEWRKSYGSS